eukprot:CAMPEP_0168538416 /NCGR_PEP_ID=MMETSP0405-20121227/21082_1 /TAXON_ID=498012 /ORGANISM="Trichosphaerium sp, Strain Am-I-7 wt" /LENGTH=293 /DNA_ID=CAMNT_0008567509 /DNA_START=42 /DNA_END=923 /DNA_ORIENTATION=+
MQATWPPFVQPSPIPAPPVEPNVNAIGYTPMANQGPIPPHPPVITEPIPALARGQRQAEKKAHYNQKGSEIQNKKKKSRGGFFASLSNTLEQVTHEVVKTVDSAAMATENATRRELANQASDRFRRFFRLPWLENLWGEFTCKIVNGPSMFVVGYLFVSDNYLCYSGLKSNVGRLSMMIPLKNIVTIQPAVSLSASDSTKPPIIQLPTPQAKPNAIFVYTRDGTIHQFYSFYSYDKCRNVLDHAWRACYHVPFAQPFPIPLSQPLPPAPPSGQRVVPGGHTLQQYPGSEYLLV